MRERTVLGPTGLDHFFLSQNVQFEAYILYIKHRSASFTLVQEDFVYLNYIGWSENNTETEQPFETPRAAKNYIQVEIVPSIVADYRVSTWKIIMVRFKIVCKSVDGDNFKRRATREYILNLY